MRRVLRFFSLFLLALVLLGFFAPTTQAAAASTAGGKTISWSMTCSSFSAEGVGPNALSEYNYPPQYGILLSNAYNNTNLIPSYMVASGVSAFKPTKVYNYFNASLFDPRLNWNSKWNVYITFPHVYSSFWSPASRKVRLWNTSGGFYQDFYVVCNDAGNVTSKWTQVILSW